MSYQPPIGDSDVIDGLFVRHLELIGLWGVINDYRTAGKRNWAIKTQVLLTLLLTVPYIFCQYLCYFVIQVDIEKATFLNLHSVSSLQVCCKVLVFWFRMDSQCRLYDLVRRDFLVSIPRAKRAESREIYQKITKKYNVFCLIVLIVHISIVAISIIYPGVSVDYIAHETGSMAAVTGGKKKILGGWYPLPMAESPYYEAIYVYEAVLIAWGGVFLGVYNCFYYQVLICLYAQFSVFGYHMSTINANRNSTVTRGSDSAMYKELYQVLQEHQELLKYASELRSVYNPLVTMVLGMGTPILVISVFQFLFGGKGSPMYIFRSFQYIVYQCIEVSMYCLGSSFIETASSELQVAIYSSDWYRADTKFRKAAQMLMVRARKGETLTAFKMYPVNMETLMSILQFTYTVAALMSRMIEK